ncbi:hypothetical protein LTR99_008619 [Exophiala xenobiotica]|uniref:FAD dependent oxidoreductase domain-containing protein n=1 Tax=Vermiconidia calcicola TaxID=1690605 RepID=A0AAV9Q123_9PEZI|nr:hypothetical protein LTR92_008235 [Exophiala xenobiotica]KAK5533008.1 hypothetical protein LTR25_007713 [Vermiconidia calcicola]KAK5534341.1 hypothetical protein LTR23_008770 [Chaetothyriales sp. CCFEE 6169]KAK5269919.1 hypothetical protein LTR96_004418 [Exophiala xenobiotica]KAK5296977.1 hypothetical protein LTR99_008619 [Exophiala xenobiotica]
MGDASAPLPYTGQAGLPSANPTKSFWQTSYPNPITHHRSTGALPSKASVVVIGTGISGTFATHELLANAADDLDVLVLEARTTCSAATGRNGGHLQPLIHSESTAIIDFELRNYHHIANMVKDNNIPCDFRQLPGCLGFWSKTYFDEAKAALHSKAEVAGKHRSLVRIVEDPQELSKLRLTGGVVGAIVQDIAASLSPYKLMIWLWTEMLREHEPGSLNLQTETPVLSIASVEDGEGWVLHTDRGDVQAKRVIFTTNGYTSHLLPQFARLISPTQAQMSALIPPKDSPFTDTLIPKSYGMMGVGAQDRVMSDYLVQNPILHREDRGVVGHGGHLMFGGGRAEAQGHGEGVSDDDYVDADVEKYLRCLPERLNLSTVADNSISGREAGGLLDIAASWTGIIGSSADGHPWVGGVPGSPGLFVAAGYSGHGMTNAGLCGRHVARLAIADVKGADWMALQAKEVDIAESEQDGGVPREYVITQERMDAVGEGSTIDQDIEKWTKHLEREPC